MKIGYWSCNCYNVMMLIPKTRGTGFLRQPIGHHQNKLGIFVDEEIRYNGSPIVTYCGLDGYLSLEIKYTWRDEFSIIENDIVKPIGEFIGASFNYVEHDDFLKMVQNSLTTKN